MEVTRDVIETAKRVAQRLAGNSQLTDAEWRIVLQAAFDAASIRERNDFA